MDNFIFEIGETVQYKGNSDVLIMILEKITIENSSGIVKMYGGRQALSRWGEKAVNTSINQFHLCELEKIVNKAE